MPVDFQFRIHLSLIAAGMALAVFARWMDWPGITSVSMAIAIISFIHLLDLGTDT